MHHRTTLAGALCAVFFLALSATTTLAAPAPAMAPAPAPAAMKAKAPAPAAMEAKAPAATAKPAPAPTGKATAEPDSKDTPPSEPAPTPAAGASTPWSPDSAEDPHREAKRRRGHDHRLTSIVVPIAFFLAILLLVGTIQYMGFRKDRNKHQTLRLMVEKGARIPVELITTQKRQGSDLRKGLVLVGTGLGIALFLLMTKDARNSGAFGLGLIPALIGAGYLLAWKLEGRKQAAQSQPTLGYDSNPELATTQRDDPDALSSGALPTDTDNNTGDR